MEQKVSLCSPEESMQATTRGKITSVVFFPSGLVRVYFGIDWEEWRQVDAHWNVVGWKRGSEWHTST